MRDIAVWGRDDADDALRSGARSCWWVRRNGPGSMAWAMKIARHRGMKKAIVAGLARRLAVILHRMYGLTAPSSAGPGVSQPYMEKRRESMQ